MSDEKISWEEFLKLKNSPMPIYKMRVVSGSMEPIIEIGEYIVVERTEQVEVNDIVVFWQNGLLICHTLWHKNRVRVGGKMVMITRGYYSYGNDLSISTEQILGKVINFRLSRWDILKFRLKSRFKWLR